MLHQIKSWDSSLLKSPACALMDVCKEWMAMNGTCNDDSKFSILIQHKTPIYQ